MEWKFRTCSRVSKSCVGMTDRIEKALRVLDSKQRRQLEDMLELVKQGRLSGLDVKKLRGREDVYRVRKGKMRVMFQKCGDEIYVLAVERRSDTTYK